MEKLKNYYYRSIVKKHSEKAVGITSRRVSTESKSVINAIEKCYGEETCSKRYGLQQIEKTLLMWSEKEIIDSTSKKFEHLCEAAHENAQ
jgi:hypothetical protein